MVRDKITWIVLQVCQYFCGAYPDTRTIDINGLNITATRERFLDKHDTLMSYLHFEEHDQMPKAISLLRQTSAVREDEFEVGS